MVVKTPKSVFTAPRPSTGGGGVLGSLAAMTNPTQAVFEAKDHTVPSVNRLRLGNQPKNQPPTPGTLVPAPDDEETYRRQRATDFKVGRNLFNRNPEQGMAYLILRGFVQANPSAIATMFSSRLGFNRQRIGEFLSTPPNQSKLAASVLSRLAASVDMVQVDLDVALRRFLALFHLPGEAQRIERIVRVFAHQYCSQNPSCYQFLGASATFEERVDLALLLAYAIVMVNTDLHSTAITDKNRMTAQEFISNFQGADRKASAMPAETLADIYERIRLSPLAPTEDNTTLVGRVEEAILNRQKPLVAPQRRLVSFCCQVELKGDPLRGSQQQNKPTEKPPTSAHHPSHGRRSFPASLTDGLRNRQTNAKNGAERQLFLFNDMLVVTKVAARKQQQITGSNKRQSLGANQQNQSSKLPADSKEKFVFRRALPLSILSFATFATPTAPFGIRLTTVEEGSKLPSTLFFCARSAEDHQHFVQDLQDAIAEAALTEVARLDLEKCPLPLLDKLFDPLDFEEPSTVEDAKIQQAPSTPPRCVISGSSSSSSDVEATMGSQNSRLLRRHSRTSLDSGVGEIGSQMSIAIAPAKLAQIQASSAKQALVFSGSRSAEKNPDSAKVSPPSSPLPTTERCVPVKVVANKKVQTAKLVSTASVVTASRSRARSVDALC